MSNNLEAFLMNGEFSWGEWILLVLCFLLCVGIGESVKKFLSKVKVQEFLGIAIMVLCLLLGIFFVNSTWLARIASIMNNSEISAVAAGAFAVLGLISGVAGNSKAAFIAQEISDDTYSKLIKKIEELESRTLKRIDELERK